jgi:hypothetical protein
MMALLKAAAQQQVASFAFSPLVDAVSAGGVGSSPASVPKYSGLTDGDVLLAFWGGYETTTTTWDVAWTVLDAHESNGGDPDRSAKILWKVVADAASEPATYEPASVSGSGGYGNTLTVATLRGVDNTTPIDAFNAIGNAYNTATPVCPSLTTVTAGAHVFAFAMTSNLNDPVYVSNDNGGALVAEEHSDSFASNDCSQVVVSFTQGAAGATGDTTFTYTNATAAWDWATTHVAVRPA